MSLVVKRNDGETWRECVIRYAKPWGLEEECLEIYDEQVGLGNPESDAAFNACLEWDVLDFVND